MAESTEVLIIGGGVIGAASALELSRRGVRVTVIDRGAIGHGCSYGNAGWLTPCLALPLPMPGMILKSLGLLFDPEGPLYIQPRWNWELVRWLARFMAQTREPTMRRSIRALTSLASHSLTAYRQLEAARPGTFGFTQRGLLVVAQTSKGLDACVRRMELVAPQGIPGRKLTAEEVYAMEPAISRGSLLGGTYFPNEAHAEPLLTVRALIAEAEKEGATVLSQTEVFAFERVGRRVTAVRTTRGPIKAGSFVLAAGSYSPPLAKMLGLRLPILGGKGYAVAVEGLPNPPKIPTLMIERKVGIAPRSSGVVHFAGTLELVERDESVTARRVDALLRGGRDCIDMPTEPHITEVWRGLRPCTPDGVPVIDRAPRLDNVTIAAGHQMLGMLTGPGTGRMVADLVTGVPPIFDPAPFRATRF